MSEASIEKRIVASCIKNRNVWWKLKKHVDSDTFSPYGEWCLDRIEEYFEKDPSKDSVDIAYLTELCEIRFDNPSKAGLYKTYIEEASGVDVSAVNLAELVLEGKRKALGARLAQALVNDNGSDNTRRLLEEYNDLELSSIDEDDKEQIFNNVSVESINETVLSPEGRIQLSPRILNEKVEGGVLPGHHIVVFARPETGKTALMTTLVRMFCVQELPGIYFGNEDPILSVIERGQACLSGLGKDDRRRDPKAAQKLLDDAGYKNATYIPIHPGSISEITKHVVRLKPKWIIVDQIRNLNVGGETRVNQLEMAAQGIRNLSKKYNLVGISVTQAGDSADNKLVLGMGDIDFSNTGIPATADLMIGVGVNDEYYRQGLVMLSLPKNKVSGKHEHFQCRINKDLSRIESL